VKTSSVATRTKFYKLMPEFDTIHALFTTLEMTFFMRRDTIHSTTQITCTLHKTHRNTTTMNLYQINHTWTT